MSFTNSVVGGQGALVRPAIKSPNFVPGISGWTINKDGTAQFTGITLLGGLQLIYSSPPGPGKLLQSSSAAAGTDVFGNAYLQGLTSYFNTGAGFTADNVNGGQIRFYAATTEAGPWTEQAVISGFGAPALPGQTSLVMQPGAVSVTPAFSVGNFGSVREWYPPSGGDDFPALDSVISAGFGSADLMPGTYELSAQLPVSGATLQGCDMATVIRPFGGYAGSLFAAGSKGSIRNLAVQNCLANAIEILPGISESWLLDLYFASNVGYCIHGVVTAPIHGRIRGIRGAGGGSANGGGIFLNGGTGNAVTCEMNISDIDIQNCLTNEVLHFLSVTDCLVSKVNGSNAPANTNNVLYVEGACQTVHLLGLDCGVNSGGTPSGPAVLMFAQGTGNNSPTDCIANGKVQSGAVGCIVNDASARISITDLYATRCQSDGFQANNTGAFNVLTKYLGNQNGLGLPGVGTAYDASITNTGHWLIDGMRGVSAGVTKNRNITQALNHVTVINDPAGTTTAGNAPAGW